MRISVKLGIFFLAVVGLFVGFSVVLGESSRNLIAGYDSVLSGPVVDAQKARIIQVTFKKQVQEWKDILLRGHNPADLEKYSANFDQQSNEVKRLVSELEAQTTDPNIRDALKSFAAAHQKLGTEYAAAKDVYLKNNYDFKAADALVRGKDRAPTDIFEGIVTKLTVDTATSVREQKASSERIDRMAIYVSIGVLLVICVGGGMLIRSITSRLARLREMSERLARAEIDGLQLDISGNDEIGAFGSSMQGVHAALMELMHLAEQSASASAE